MNTNTQPRVAVVTGGARGIGRAIGEWFLRRGYKVALLDRDAAPLDRTITEIGRPDDLLGVHCDVSDPAQVDQAAGQVMTTLGRVDALVNNAGVAVFKPALETSFEEWRTVMATNLDGAFLCTQAVWPGMRARGWGRIINISSGAARGAGGFGPHYNASKAGMEGLTRGYAARLVKFGITVNAVAPSLIDTEMIAAMRAESTARIPLGRLGAAEEVAAAVVMVASNAYMTGQTVAMNGGLNFN